MRASCGRYRTDAGSLCLVAASGKYQETPWQRYHSDKRRQKRPHPQPCRDRDVYNGDDNGEGIDGDKISCKISLKIEEKMKVYYDKKVDALYIKLGVKSPEGVVEISEGVNLDTTSEGKIVGIEILDASKKIDIKTILSYTLELDKKLLSQKVA